MATDSLPKVLPVTPYKETGVTVEPIKTKQENLVERVKSIVKNIFEVLAYFFLLGCVAASSLSLFGAVTTKAPLVFLIGGISCGLGYEFCRTEEPLPKKATLSKPFLPSSPAQPPPTPKAPHRGSFLSFSYYNQPLMTTLTTTYLIKQGSEVGIGTKGMHCYINATLQLVFPLFSQVIEVLSEKTFQDLLPQGPLFSEQSSKQIQAIRRLSYLYRFLTAYKELPSQEVEKIENISYPYFKEFLKMRSQQNSTHFTEMLAQQDAHEYLRFLLSHVKGDWELIGEDPCQLNFVFKLEEETLSISKQGEELANRKKTESYEDISLELREDSEAASMQQSLHHFFAKEELDKDNWLSFPVETEEGSVIKPFPTFKSYSFHEKLPDHLLIQIKRFAFYAGRSHKIKTTIPDVSTFTFSSRFFPSSDSEGSSTQMQEYNLIGFTVHIGESLRSGHFITFRKSNEKWYCYNDDKVSEVPEEEITSSKSSFNTFKASMYLGLYKKREVAEEALYQSLEPNERKEAESLF